MLMKKGILFALAAVACTSFASGQHKPKVKLTAKVPTTIACPIMSSNKVNVASATKAGMFADYKGRRYVFCCDMCPAAFKKDPAKYAKAASFPTPKKTK